MIENRGKGMNEHKKEYKPKDIENQHKTMVNDELKLKILETLEKSLS